MSLIDNILDAESGQPMKCPIGLAYKDKPELGTELEEAVDSKANGQFVVTSTAISKHLEKEWGMNIKAPAIRNHRRGTCACLGPA